MKKLSKKTKTIGIYSLAAVVLMGASGVGTQQFMHKKMVKQKEEFDILMAEKDALLAKYEQQSIVAWTVSKAAGLKAGDVVLESDITQIKLPNYFVPDASGFITKKEDIVGKTIKLDTPKNSYVLSSMVYSEGKLDSSSRKREVDFIRLPYKLQTGEKVDINIVYPDGTSYIVVAKKKLDEVDLPAQLVYFNSTKEEDLLLTSALVDAYMSQAEIHAIQYVEAEMQDKPAVTYIPRVEVLDLLQADPQIVEKARWSNMSAVRKSLDQAMRNYNPADLKVKDGLKRVEAVLPEGSGVMGRRTNQNPGPSAPTPDPNAGIPPQGTAPVDSAQSPQPTNQPAASVAPESAPPNTFAK